MSDCIDFYFDFISPYSYLAHCRLPAIADQHGLEIAYHVVDLAAIKLGAGNTGPTTREMPLKLLYSGADQQRWAARYGVTIKRPSAYGPNRLNEGVFWAADQGEIGKYVTATWRRVWGEGGDMTDPTIMLEVATELGWNISEFLAYLESSDAELRYRASTREAHQRGVFGVPTMMIDKEMWWGNDRLGFMEEFLAE